MSTEELAFIETSMLRDLFAATAMHALINSEELTQLYAAVSGQEALDKLKTACCRNCYSWADAMLKARQS